MATYVVFFCLKKLEGKSSREILFLFILVYFQLSEGVKFVLQLFLTKLLCMCFICKEQPKGEENTVNGLKYEVNKDYFEL